MPNYQFKCKKCSKESTQFLLMVDRDNPKKCDCGGKNQRNYPQGTGFGQLKLVPHLDWHLHRD